MVIPPLYVSGVVILDHELEALCPGHLVPLDVPLGGQVVDLGIDGEALTVVSDPARRCAPGLVIDVFLEEERGDPTRAHFAR